MKFSSFLKLFVFAFVSIPWKCREFWALLAIFSLLAMTGSAPLFTKIVCVASIMTTLVLIATLVNVQRMFREGKASDAVVDALWNKMVGRSPRS